MATKVSRTYTCTDTGEVIVGYPKYLKTLHWKNKKLEFFASKYYHGGCSECGAKKVDVHHKNYDTVGDEDLKCLVALCRECHSKAHGIGPKKTNTKKKAPKTVVAKTKASPKKIVQCYVCNSRSKTLTLIPSEKKHMRAVCPDCLVLLANMATRFPGKSLTSRRQHILNDKSINPLRGKKYTKTETWRDVMKTMP